MSNYYDYETGGQAGPGMHGGMPMQPGMPMQGGMPMQRGYGYWGSRFGMGGPRMGSERDEAVLPDERVLRLARWPRS